MTKSLSNWGPVLTASGEPTETGVLMDPETGNYGVTLDIVIPDEPKDLPDGFDQTYEGDGEDAAIRLYAAHLGQRFGVEHEILKLHGPSGGWPEILFWGTPTAIRKMMSWYDQDDSYLTLGIA